MEETNNGLFWCPVCGNKAAVWGADFDTEDYGYDRAGVVHTYTCSCCGSDIEAIEYSEAENELG